MAYADCPLFVTWYIEKEEDLRGCIGTFSSSDIRTTLPKYALIAAMQDTRFEPIRMSEVRKLTCGVSFLTDFEKGFKAYDWEVGRHGIIIDFSAPDTGRNCNATFLPEVAEELGGDKEVVLKHLISKAGYKGDYKKAIPLISLTRYQSSKTKLSFQDFAKLDPEAANLVK